MIFKKLSVFLLLSVIQSSFLFSQANQEKSYYEYESIDLEASITYGFNSSEGYETYISFFQPFFFLNTNHLSLLMGMQLNQGSFDFTSSGIFWIFHSNRFRVGAGADYHFNYYDDVSRTNDIMLNSYFQTRPFQKFGLDLVLGYLFKSRTIFEIEDYKSALWTQCLEFSIQTNFYPIDAVQLFARASSYETFRYFVFLAPSFTFGTKITSPEKKFFIAYDVTFRYVDFFTLSTYFDGKEYRLSIGMKL